MAHFLKGRYQIFYKNGKFECVKDTIRIQQFSQNKVQLQVTRRDMETYAKRFLMFDYYTINLHPLEEENPSLGGKVTVQNFKLDFQTLIPSYQKLYGVYSDEFVIFGEHKEIKDGSLLTDEGELIKIADSADQNSFL